MMPFFFFLLLDSVDGSALAALPAVDSEVVPLPVAAVPVVVAPLLVAGEAAGAGGVEELPVVGGGVVVSVIAGAAAGAVSSAFGAAVVEACVEGGGVPSEFIGSGRAEFSVAGAAVSAGAVSVPPVVDAGTDVSEPAGTVSTATEFPDATPLPPPAMTPGGAEPGLRTSTADVVSAGGCKFG